MPVPEKYVYPFSGCTPLCRADIEWLLLPPNFGPN